MNFKSVIHYSLFIITCFLFSSCNNNKNQFDASGSFETDETIISAQASGTILQFNILEGQTLQEGQNIGYIDTVQLYLKKKQLEAQIAAALSRRPDIAAQLASLEEQLKTAEREKKRVENLIQANAAPHKQLDDATSQVDVIKKQIVAQQSSLGITTQGITKDVTPLQVQIDQMNDQLAKSKIINPINGTVLTKYAMQNEVATPGKPLYKIADLSNLFLRAYISGNQFSQIKLDQKVKVLVDNGEKSYKEYEGAITWISDKAEFTPKTIQTKEERTNLVYAIKIKVKNDGFLKIGMYGEVKFE